MGAVFKIPAFLLYAIGGIWGFFICLGIISSKFGTIITIICFFILPITLYLAPFYAGFADGNWFPLAIVYGSGIGAAVLYQIGAALDGDNR